MKAPPSDFLARFDALDRALVRAGFPATSPWWRAQIARFFASGTSAPARRRWIVRAGRRAGKSTTLARLAVAWALFGDHSVPPGDIGVIAFVSLSKDEASSRLRTISAVLDTLGIKYEQRGDEIEVSASRRVLFKVFACNTSAVVGFTSIAVFGDEVARWESRDTGANPAREVIASLAPTMATQPTAFMVLSSSPWSVDDYHAEAFDLGETAYQITSFAPTWVANPTITEAETHALEPDVRIHSREYAAVPSSSVAAAFDADLVLETFKPRAPAGGPAHSGWIALDPSSLRGDGFGVVCGTTSDSDEVVITGAGEFPAEMGLRAIVDRVVDLARSLNVRTVYSDQREEAALRLLFEEKGIALVSFAWSETSKQEAVAIITRWMTERRLLVVPARQHAEATSGGAPARETGAERLRREMLMVKARLMPSGRVQYNTNGLDVVSCVVTLAHAANAGDFSVGQPVNALYAHLAKLAASGDAGLAPQAALAQARINGTGWY